MKDFSVFGCITRCHVTGLGDKQKIMVEFEKFNKLM